MRRYFKKIFFTIILSTSLLVLYPHYTHADPISKTDTSGTITGTVGTTYYDVTSWDDMKTAYQNAPANKMVYLNVTSDIQPSSMLSSDGIAISDTKSITILGNNHTLILDGGLGGSGINFTSNYAFNDSKTPTTSRANFNLYNAILINDIVGGLFQINGSGNITYQNVTETNGLPLAGARPFINKAGTINLLGKNQFNILANTNKQFAGYKIQDISSYNSLLGNDGNGEWIRGNATINVYGQTTLNQNWLLDQPFWYLNNSTNASLHVWPNASLYFNLNNTYTMAYADLPITSNWQIDQNATFNINGTNNTSRGGLLNNNWDFYSQVNQNITLGKHATFSAVTAGELTALNSLDVGPNATFNLQNIGPISTIDAASNKATINIADSADVTLRGNNSVFDTGLLNSTPQNTTINLNGIGLVTAASKNNQLTTDSNSFVTTLPTQGKVLANFKDLTNLTNPYNATQVNILTNAHYLHWYPQTQIVTFGSSDADRLFNVTYAMLPPSGAFSDLLSAAQPQNFTIHATTIKTPNVNLSVALTNNSTPTKTAYFWKSIDNQVSSQLTNQPTTISTLSPDAPLLSNITKTTDNGAADYKLVFDQNHGLLLKMRNTLAKGTQTNATLTYTLTNAPA